MTKISAVVPDEHARWLEARALAEDRSVSAVIRRAIASTYCFAAARTTPTERRQRMSAEVNPDVLLATARARLKAARGHARPAESRGGVSSMDDATATRRILKAWKRKRFRLPSGTSTLRLPSGASIAYDWEREEVVK